MPADDQDKHAKLLVVSPVKKNFHGARDLFTHFEI
jgi:hypothetical protein